MNKITWTSNPKMATVMAVIAPVWARFLSTLPDVQLEVHADEALVDIVARGFDAGISSKDLAAADMIAVRVMGPMRVTVVGAPAYFARRRPPRTPDDRSEERRVGKEGRSRGAGTHERKEVSGGRTGTP